MIFALRWGRLLHYRPLKGQPDFTGRHPRVEIVSLHMKQPEEPVIGATRKSLPERKSRKVQKDAPPALSGPGKKAKRTGNILDKGVEQELVKVFGKK